MFSLFYVAGMLAYDAKRYNRAVGLLLKAESLARFDEGRNIASFYRKLSQAWVNRLVS